MNPSKQKKDISRGFYTTAGANALSSVVFFIVYAIWEGEGAYWFLIAGCCLLAAAVGMLLLWQSNKSKFQ